MKQGIAIAIHGGDHKTGVTMLTQCIAEHLAERFLKFCTFNNVRVSRPQFFRTAMEHFGHPCPAILAVITGFVHFVIHSFLFVLVKYKKRPAVSSAGLK